MDAERPPAAVPVAAREVLPECWSNAADQILVKYNTGQIQVPVESDDLLKCLKY